MAKTEAQPNQDRANGYFRTLRWVGRLLFRALFAIELEGFDQLPRSGGYVLACNHLSWIDPLLLLAYLPAEPRIHFMAASEYTVDGPWLVRLIVKYAGGIIPVDRQSHKGDRAAVIQSLRVLRGGGVLGIFPEGRCGEVEGAILPLKEGAATFATKTGRPILVVGLSGTYELCFRRRLRLRVGPLVEPQANADQDGLVQQLAEAMVKTIPPLHPKQPKRRWLGWLGRMFD